MKTKGKNKIFESKDGSKVDLSNIPDHDARIIKRRMEEEGGAKNYFRNALLGRHMPRVNGERVVYRGEDLKIKFWKESINGLIKSVPLLLFSLALLGILWILLKASAT